MFSHAEGMRYLVESPKPGMDVCNVLGSGEV